MQDVKMTPQTIKEAKIVLLQNLVDTMPTADSRYPKSRECRTVRALVVAIEALKLREPKEPIAESKIKICPNCHSRVNVKHTACHRCGQILAKSEYIKKDR